LKEKKLVNLPIYIVASPACIPHTVKPVLRGHIWDKEKVSFQDRWPLKRGSIHMKFSKKKVTL
jgi:hypothetical protein